MKLTKTAVDWFVVLQRNSQLHVSTQKPPQTQRKNKLTLNKGKERSKQQRTR